MSARHNFVHGIAVVTSLLVPIAYS